MHQNSRHGTHRRGAVTSSSGLGNPTPTHTTSLAHLPIFTPPVFRFTCRPSGALYAVFYKHAAPLGLNAAMHQNSRHGTHRRGEVSSPDGLGNPTPTHTTSLAHLPIFTPPVFRFTCRPSGALCYAYSLFYKPAAPLGLNAAMHQNSRHGTHRRGEVSSPDGLGNPTPTGLRTGSHKGCPYMETVAPAEGHVYNIGCESSTIT